MNSDELILQTAITALEKASMLFKSEPYEISKCLLLLECEKENIHGSMPEIDSATNAAEIGDR